MAGYYSGVFTRLTHAAQEIDPPRVQSFFKKWSVKEPTEQRYSSNVGTITDTSYSVFSQMHCLTSSCLHLRNKRISTNLLFFQPTSQMLAPLLGHLYSFFIACTLAFE